MDAPTPIMVFVAIQEERFSENQILVALFHTLFALFVKHICTKDPSRSLIHADFLLFITPTQILTRLYLVIVITVPFAVSSVFETSCCFSLGAHNQNTELFSSFISVPSLRYLLTKAGFNLKLIIQTVHF